MTNRVAYAPQDFQKMCKQAERDHESKKLVVLMERVKRQIAERAEPGVSRTQARNGTVNPRIRLPVPFAASSSGPIDEVAPIFLTLQFPYVFVKRKTFLFPQDAFALE